MCVLCCEEYCRHRINVHVDIARPCFLGLHLDFQERKSGRELVNKAVQIWTVGMRKRETVLGRVEPSSMIPSGPLVSKAPIRLHPPILVPQEHCQCCILPITP